MSAVLADLIDPDLHWLYRHAQCWAARTGLYASTAVMTVHDWINALHDDVAALRLRIDDRDNDMHEAVDAGDYRELARLVRLVRRRVARAQHAELSDGWRPRP